MSTLHRTTRQAMAWCWNHPARHQRLLKRVATFYRDRGLEFEDLVGYGQFGLLKARAEFDTDWGTKFSTFAVQGIRNAIRDGIRRGSETIKIPAYLIRLITKQIHPDDPAADLKPETRERLREAYATRARRAISGSDDLAAAPPVLLAEPDLDDLGSLVRAALGELEDRDQLILRQHYGIDTAPTSLSQIARTLGVTKERVRQIEKVALARFKTALQGRGLWSNPYAAD